VKVRYSFLARPEADGETLRIVPVREHATAGTEVGSCLAALLTRLGHPGAGPMGTLEVGLRVAPRAGVGPVESLTGFARHVDAIKP
jgi:hypothetical protein